jgi:hypothetical protein
MDTFDAYMEYAGDNAVSNNTGRAKEPASLATDGVRATLASLFSRHGLSGAAGILLQPQMKDSGTVPPPLLHSGYSGVVKSEHTSPDAPEGLPITTTYSAVESGIDIGDGSNPGSPLTAADRGGYPVVVTGMFPRGHVRGWGPPPRHTLHSNPSNMHPNLPPVVESVPPLYTRPPPPIQHRPMNPWGGGRSGGKFKPWNAQGHSTTR